MGSTNSPIILNSFFVFSLTKIYNSLLPLPTIMKLSLGSHATKWDTFESFISIYSSFQLFWCRYPWTTFPFVVVTINCLDKFAHFASAIPCSSILKLKLMCMAAFSITSTRRTVPKDPPTIILPPAYWEAQSATVANSSNLSKWGNTNRDMKCVWLPAIIFAIGRYEAMNLLQ